MTFAIYLEPSDFASLAGSLRSVSLPNTIKTRVISYWNGGLKDWAAAPLGHAPTDLSCPLCRRLVVTTGTLTDFIQLCRDAATWFRSQGISPDWLEAFATEFSQPQGGTEPYP